MHIDGKEALQRVELVETIIWILVLVGTLTLFVTNAFSYIEDNWVRVGIFVVAEIVSILGAISGEILYVVTSKDDGKNQTLYKAWFLITTLLILGLICGVTLGGMAGIKGIVNGWILRISFFIPFVFKTWTLQKVWNFIKG